MTIHGRGLHPVMTAVASSTGANDLTATIDSVDGKITRIYGIDVSYSITTSRQHVDLQDAGASKWSSFVDRGIIGRNWSQAPIELSRATSIQVVCDQPGGSDNGRCVVHYTQTKD